MKLHLPKMLTVALLAALASFTQAQAAAPQTIGQTLTWDAGNADASAGKYVMTTFDQDGNVTYGQTYQGWNQAGMQQFFYNQMGNRNTLRFSSDKGSGQKTIQYTFNWFTVGGIMVDTGATDFDIHTAGTISADRSFYLGTTVNGTTAYSTIREDFSLIQTSTNEKSLIHLQGNQVFDVENGNTFHLKQSNNYALDFDTQLTVQGGGTVAFDGTSAVAMTGNASLTVMADSTVTFAKDVTGLATTITNNGTINFNGTVSLADSLSGFEVSGTFVDYQEEPADNGYAVALNYTIIEGNTNALTSVKWKGVTQTLDQGVMHVDVELDKTNYHLVTTDYTLDLAAEMGLNDQLSKVTMAAGTTLNYNTNNYSGTIETAATSTVSIAAGVTLSTPLTAGIIAGQGTYALASGTSSMGAVTRGAGWTGTVKLTDVPSMTNIDLNAYGQQGSKVEMAGITGYFTSVSSVFTPELVLSGSGLVLNDGFSTSAGAPTAYTFAGGVSGAGNMTFSHKNGTGSNVTQHLYFTGNVSGWTGSLDVVAGFTVYAQYSGASQTVNSIITKTNGTLNVEVGTGADESVVTFAKAITSSSLSVLAGATANVNGGLTTGTITVGENATLAINGSTTLTSAITSAGTVTLTNVALSDAFTESEGGSKRFDIADTANYYMGTADKYLTVVTGGTATGSGLSWNGRTGLTMENGQVVTGEGSANYTTLYIGGDTTTEQIAAYDHAADLTNIVVESGTLTVTEPLGAIGIEVSDHGTIAGEVDPTEVGIAVDATAEFTKPVEGTGYSFTPAEGGTVAVTNKGEAPATYSSNNRSMTVVADTLTAPTPWEDVTISNKVQVANVEVADASILTLDNVAEGSLQLQNLTIGTMAFVSVYASEEQTPANEATVVISDTLKAGGMSTLNANLTMLGNSTLDLITDEDSLVPLTLGSVLTFNTANGLINLDEETINYLSGMQDGDRVALFTRSFNSTLGYGGKYDGLYYGNLFNRTDALVGDFMVYANEDSFGLTKYSNVPEPTTGTLSLLALAALAARRRRK